MPSRKILWKPFALHLSQHYKFTRCYLPRLTSKQSCSYNKEIFLSRRLKWASASHQFEKQIFVKLRNITIFNPLNRYFLGMVPFIVFHDLWRTVQQKSHIFHVNKERSRALLLFFHNLCESAIYYTYPKYILG